MLIKTIGFIKKVQWQTRGGAKVQAWTKTKRGELIGSKPKPPVLTLISDKWPLFVFNVRILNGNTYRELCARYQDP